jgi:hypothetical protein
MVFQKRIKAMANKIEKTTVSVLRYFVKRQKGAATEYLNVDSGEWVTSIGLASAFKQAGDAEAVARIRIAFSTILTYGVIFAAVER